MHFADVKLGLRKGKNLNELVSFENTELLKIAINAS